MNFIIDDIDVNNIRIKKNLKILYNYNSVQLLGIPLQIKFKNYEFNNDYIKLFLEDNTINLINKIDNYFKRFNNYKPLLNTNYINIYKNKNIDLISNEIKININSLKKNDIILYLDIYTI